MERRNFLQTTALAGAGLVLAGCNEADAAEEGAACTALALIDPVQPALIGPGEGEVADDEDGRYKVRVADVGNYWSIMEMTLAPLQLLTPHTHEEYDQAVYLIEGELGFEFGGEGGEVLYGGAGSYVIKPRGLSHSFWNTSDTTTVRYIEMSAGPTFEKFVDVMKDTNDIIAINKAAKEYSVEFHYDQIMRLMSEHGLTSVKGTAVTLPQLDEFNGPPMP
jgi:quercetin dioxygenase-like cupin family protein